MTEAREWTVKCLRETFVPMGALLIGPAISTDEIVVEKSAYLSIKAQLEQVNTENKALKGNWAGTWIAEPELHNLIAERDKLRARVEYPTSDRMGALVNDLKDARAERDEARQERAMLYEKTLELKRELNNTREKLKLAETCLNWIVNNSRSFGLDAEPYCERARETLEKLK